MVQEVFVNAEEGIAPDVPGYKELQFVQHRKDAPVRAPRAHGGRTGREAFEGFFLGRRARCFNPRSTRRGSVRR